MRKSCREGGFDRTNRLTNKRGFSFGPAGELHKWERVRVRERDRDGERKRDLQRGEIQWVGWSE